MHSRNKVALLASAAASMFQACDTSTTATPGVRGSVVILRSQRYVP